MPSLYWANPNCRAYLGIQSWLSIFACYGPTGSGISETEGHRLGDRIIESRA